MARLNTGCITAVTSCSRFSINYWLFLGILFRNRYFSLLNHSLVDLIIHYNVLTLFCSLIYQTQRCIRLINYIQDLTRHNKFTIYSLQ